MKYPDNIKSRKAKAAYWVFYQFYTWSMGQGKVIGRFTGMIPEMGTLILIIKTFGFYNIQWWQVPLFFIFGITLSYIIGKYYMRHNLDLIESQVLNERDIFRKELCKKLIDKGEDL